MLQASNYNQQFLVINFVVVFDEHYVFVEESYEMKNFIIVVLKKHFVIDIIESIGFQNNFFVAIEITKHKSSNNRFFEIMKNFITNFGLLKKKSFMVNLFIHLTILTKFRIKRL